jgi:hypothetical protein
MSDHRFTWGDKYILLRQDSKEPLPQKVGMLNTSGWAAYARAGFLFLKKFDIPTTGKYPDLNTNLECWSNQELLELETLAPLELLEPGNSLSHRENWYLAQNVPQPANDVDVDQNVLPVVGLFRLSKL